MNSVGFSSSSHSFPVTTTALQPYASTEDAKPVNASATNPSCGLAVQRAPAKTGDGDSTAVAAFGGGGIIGGGLLIAGLAASSTGLIVAACIVLGLLLIVGLFYLVISGFANARFMPGGTGKADTPPIQPKLAQVDRPSPKINMPGEDRLALQALQAPCAGPGQKLGRAGT